MRDYSLCNDPAERRRYCIAVLRERDGEGSRQLHETVRVGDPVEVSLPRNNFPLAEEAERHLFLAGGIGITPIMAMIAELRRCGGEFLLHYCTRSPEATAFREELDLLAAQGRVRFHHDGGDPAAGPRHRRSIARAAAGNPSLLLRPRRLDEGGRRGRRRLASGNRAFRIFHRAGRAPAGTADRGPGVSRQASQERR